LPKYGNIILETLFFVLISREAMKIESQPSAGIQTVSRQNNNKIETPQKPVQAAKQERVNADALRAKMLGWFAQAGVRPSNIAGNFNDADRDVIRRRQIVAQRKMQNLQKILDLALDFSMEQVKPENLDADWFFSFISLAEEIYSPAMQELWGKIFAVEVSRVGSFSLRTLQTLKQLTQKDAQVFQTASRLTSKRAGDVSPKILYGYYQKPNLWSMFSIPKQTQLNLAHYGLPYPDLLALMDMGLIYRSEIESGELDPQRKTEWRCGNEVFSLVARRPGITLNYYKFTSTGEELVKLVNSKPQSNYIEGLKTTLKSGFAII
jgi:uncharacterized repeat protein (TIGR03899 family)